MNLLTYAMRNVVRTRQRTWVVIGAMAFACFIMIFYAALMEGWLRATEENAIGRELGQVQIHAHGFRSDQDLYKTIRDETEILASLEGQGYQAAPRLYAFALAAAGNASAGVRLRGVDLSREEHVTGIHNHILSGAWLNESDPAGVVVGRKLAKTLGVKTGDELVVVGQAADGSMANQLFHVRGVLKSVGDGVDRGGFFMGAASFRDLMLLPSGAHEIVIRSDNEKMGLDNLTARIREIAPGYEVLNWRELQPVLARIIDLSRASLMIMLLVTYTAVGILTLNGMLMSVFERIREFGVMKAIGFSPAGVFMLIVIESFIQVSAASILALVPALPLTKFCETHPIDLSSLSSTSSSIAGVAFDPVWHTRMTFETVFMPVLFLFIVAGIAIVYPAVKAALIRPVEAIHHR